MEWSCGAVPESRRCFGPPFWISKTCEVGMNQGGGGGGERSETYPLEGVEIEFFPSGNFFIVFREMTENLCILLRLVFPELKHNPVFLAG